MSRLIISNGRQLKPLIESLQRCAEDKGTRALVVLSETPSDWTKAFAEAYGLRFVSSDPHQDRADRADKITSVLGEENSVLVFAVGPLLDASLLAAAAGTLRAGGLLVLDMGMQNISSDQYRYDQSLAGQPKNAVFSGNFQRRFNRLLSQALESDSWLSVLATVQPDNSQTDISVNLSPPVSTDQAFKHASKNHQSALLEQNHLLNRATQHLRNHEAACLLISGRRGRGKSALLARIAMWLSENKIEFSVISNHQSALRTFHKHYLRNDCPVITRIDAHHRSDHVLLVDEASNISIKLLRRFAAHHIKLVLCTTTEGYENAGRAFMVRFARQLELECKPILHIQPEHPWRWLADDCLERFIDDLLLSNQHKREQFLNSRMTEIQHFTANAICRRVDQSELSNNEDLLYQIHNLLAKNHYQSSVKDLQHLLDGSSLQVWVQQIDQQVVASLVLEIEGTIDSELHAAIVAGKRRLPHQLLPQLLAKKSTRKSVLEKRFARIVRIAVACECRRNRLASMMMQHIEHELLNSEFPVDAIGASFADDQASLAFWQSNGYKQFHHGHKVNPRTGTTSVVVIKSWDNIIDSALLEFRG